MKHGVVKNGGGATKKAVQAQKLLRPVPKGFMGQSQCGCKDFIVNLILPVILEVV